MEIELKVVTVSELAEGYQDNGEGGVVGFGGRLDVRPSFQREFIYKDKQRDAVINTVKEGFPLNVMYWAVRDDGNFEVIDGQQRTISVCQYINGDFAFENMYLHNLPEDVKQGILDYKIMVYRCSGTDSERLDWFRTINIAGEKLADQELRNAVYAGPWVADAKRHFSKNGCPAYRIASNYMSGTPIRQDYLETAIRWINKGDVEGFMAQRQHAPQATDLWLYFQSVISWVKATFPAYRKEMKGVAWGDLYNEFGAAKPDVAELGRRVGELMADEDVTRKKGIYPYVLSGQEKHLNIRQFSPNQRREAYERQGGICASCGKQFDITEMDADHITPWHKGGKTEAANCQMLCPTDNRRKSGK